MTTIGVVDAEQDRLGTGGTEVETKMWALRRIILDAHILSLQENIKNLNHEINASIMVKLKISSEQTT